jgi:heavy metal sensor kinase
MNGVPIRTRLAVWYFAVLAATFAVFGIVVLEGTSRIMLRAVDDELRDHVAGFETLLNNQKNNDYIMTFLQHSGAGDLIQVDDHAGNRLYTSPAVAGLGLPMPEVGTGGNRYDSVTARGVSYRLLTSRVRVGREFYQVQVAGSLSNYSQSKKRLIWMMMIVMPLLLVAASLGGYWLSRRALSPVDEITARARAISGRNLSDRLPVPATRDELQRLSETLNSMLGRLEQAFRRIVQFTADASHELRAPLALIQITAEVCTRRPRAEAEYRESLANILAEANKTSTLVENLLTLARSDAQSDVLTKCQMNLSETVRDACQRGRVMAEAKDLKFRTDLCPSPVWIEGNQEALIRLFLILIDNATKYSVPGGNIAVRLETNGELATVSVEDDGIGVSPEDLPHIFERFYRADKARRRSEGGSGLGLSIGQWLTEAHNGLIFCRSTLNIGSTFTVSLPISR